MNQSFFEYFRCPSTRRLFEAKEGLSEHPGFFEFGNGAVAFGRYAGQLPANSRTEAKIDAWEEIENISGVPCLPFVLDEVVENLRLERYIDDCQYGSSQAGIIARVYYALRPLLPVAFRRHLQRAYLSDWSEITFPAWPVDHSVDSILRNAMLLSLRAQQVEKVPFIWFWPDAAPAAACMTHDVETAAGRDYCDSLMSINEKYAIPASFQIVPEERYEVTESYLDSIRRRNFEVNVQDLNHDGRLYNDRARFVERAAKINEYGRRYRASGFRSAILYRRQEWYGDLDFSYDMSVPNSASLEPQRGGCCTVMPYFVGKMLELPVTTTQDYSLFNYLRQFSIDLWKKEIDLLLEQNGLISFIVHPDYIMKKRENHIYQQLLAHLTGLRADKKLWIATPGEIDRWWRQRSKMGLVLDGDGWRVEGEGSERARVAYANETPDGLAFTIDSAAATEMSTSSTKRS